MKDDLSFNDWGLETEYRFSRLHQTQTWEFRLHLLRLIAGLVALGRTNALAAIPGAAVTTGCLASLALLLLSKQSKLR
jgi:hypothetical protein